MPICPECGHKWSSKARLCPLNVAQRPRESLPRNVKRHRHTFSKVFNHLSSLPSGQLIGTKDLIELFQINNKTNGDLLRLTLDYAVCHGILEKIKFGNTSKGHLYKVVEEKKQCAFFEINGKPANSCIFNWELAKEKKFE